MNENAKEYTKEGQKAAIKVLIFNLPGMIAFILYMLSEPEYEKMMIALFSYTFYTAVTAIPLFLVKYKFFMQNWKKSSESDSEEE